MKHLAIFDNGGETFDRFTIINLQDGEMYGASLNPFHPQGFGQYCGSPAHDYFATTIGSPYMTTMSIKDPNHYKRIIKRKTAEIVQEFEQEGNIGNRVDFETLPHEVKQYCRQILELVNA